ncbi:MAG: hypothetical protein ACXV3D_07710 [Halobacteriota archaeon]
MKYAELLAGRGLRFLEVSQVLILKVTLALSVIQTAFFDAFTRHDLGKKCATHLPKHFAGVCTQPEEL